MNGSFWKPIYRLIRWKFVPGSEDHSNHSQMARTRARTRSWAKEAKRYAHSIPSWSLAYQPICVPGCPSTRRERTILLAGVWQPDEEVQLCEYSRVGTGSENICLGWSHTYVCFATVYKIQINSKSGGNDIYTSPPNLESPPRLGVFTNWQLPEEVRQSYSLRPRYSLFKSYKLWNRECRKRD